MWAISGEEMAEDLFQRVNAFWVIAPNAVEELFPSFGIVGLRLKWKI